VPPQPSAARPAACARRGAHTTHRHALPGGQLLAIELEAVHRVADGEGHAALTVGIDAQMLRGHVRVVEHELVVERAARTQRPLRHAHAVAHVAVAVQHLQQR
jgi:hypothetical protein